MKFFFAFSFLVLSFSLSTSIVLGCTESCPTTSIAKCPNDTIGCCPGQACSSGGICTCLPDPKTFKRLMSPSPLPEGTVFQCAKDQNPVYDSTKNNYICPYKPLELPASEALRP